MSRYVIDKSKLEENIKIVREKAKVPIIAVVKGNGYGFGIKEFTKILLENGINTFQNVINNKILNHFGIHLQYVSPNGNAFIAVSGSIQKKK